jgi:hypothetical protein
MNNPTLKRWRIQTNRGRRITWAPDEHTAILRAILRGYRVTAIEPADIPAERGA